MKKIKYNIQDIIDEALAKIPPERRLWFDQSFDLADKIAELMEQHYLTKAEMAKIFKVSQRKVYWIGGGHNFDLVPLAKVSTYFKEPLITVNK